jgi:hypothetical protein
MREFTKEDLEKEVWKPLFGYEEYCEASTLGRIKVLNRKFKDKRGSIKSLKEKVLRLGYYSNGYEQFSLSVENKRYTAIVHRLIALTFIPNPKNFPIINHKNGIRDDNRVENLEWCTQSYNGKHAFEVLGRVVNNVGENNPRTSLKEKDVVDIRTRYSNSESCSSIHGDYKELLSLSALKKICYGSTWKHIVI